MQVDNKETYIKTRTHSMDLKDHSKAVQSLDLSGTIIDVSPAWLNLTGYTRDEVIGKHFMEFLHGDSVLCVEKNFPFLKDFGYIDNVHLKIRAKDHSAISVTLNGTSKYNNKGTFEQTFCELILSA